MSNLSTRPQNKNFGDRAGRATSNRRLHENQIQYSLNPSTCHHCNSSLPYEKRRNKYCNQSCSASHNNTIREHTIESRLTRASKLKKPSDLPVGCCPVFFTPCTTCGRIILTKSKPSTSSYCSATCNPTFYVKTAYRSACKFGLNNQDHAELFNSALISALGWYTPTNTKTNRAPNLDGVCWDHLFRIEDGYTLRVPPHIMNHPANAELVPWAENRKRLTSMITYEELLRRIDAWDGGNRNLPTFYPRQSLVPDAGLEPATHALSTHCSNQLS